MFTIDFLCKKSIVAKMKDTHDTDTSYSIKHNKIF